MKDIGFWPRLLWTAVEAFALPIMLYLVPRVPTDGSQVVLFVMILLDVGVLVEDIPKLHRMAEGGE